MPHPPIVNPMLMPSIDPLSFGTVTGRIPSRPEPATYTFAAARPNRNGDQLPTFESFRAFLEHFNQDLDPIRGRLTGGRVAHAALELLEQWNNEPFVRVMNRPVRSSWNPLILENDFTGLEARILASLHLRQHNFLLGRHGTRLHSTLMGRVVAPEPKPKGLEQVAKDVLGFRKGPRVIEIREIEPKSWFEIVMADEEPYRFVAHLARPPEPVPILVIDSVRPEPKPEIVPKTRTWSERWRRPR